MTKIFRWGDVVTLDLGGPMDAIKIELRRYEGEAVQYHTTLIAMWALACASDPRRMTHFTIEKIIADFPEHQAELLRAQFRPLQRKMAEVLARG